MRAGKKHILGDLQLDNKVSSSILRGAYDNIMLNAFYIEINGSLSQRNMVDGSIDEFEDESGIDKTKLLLHLNNNVTDSGQGHVVTNNNMTFDAGTKKWGSHGGVFNGTTAYLTAPDSDDWDICGSALDNWTIDFWVKHDDHAGTEYYICQNEADNQNKWYIFHLHGSGLSFQMQSGGVTELTTGFGEEITDTDWHHIALCKVGSEYAIYKDGTQVNYVDDSSTDIFAGLLYIGDRGTGDRYFDGYMDEIRISHYNIFNANPVVGLTNTITIPTAESSSQGSTNEDYDSTNDLYSPLAEVDPNLELHYKLNDNASNTTVVDSSSNVVNGTLGGGDNTSVKSVGGKINNAFDLNGTDDYIDTNQTLQSVFRASFSFGAWINLDDGRVASVQTICGIRQTATNGIDFDVFNGYLRLRYKAGTGGGITRAETNVIFPDGVTGWYHVVATVDENVIGANAVKIYVNSVLQELAYGGDSGEGVDFSQFTTTTKFYVGATSDTNIATMFVSGLMDDFRIYSKVLTQTEINNLYNSGNGTENQDIEGVINNMTLISEAVTADSEPSNARIILFEEDVDSITLNTDLIAYISRDGGSTWAEVTLEDIGDYEAGKQILAGSVDLTASGIGSGTSMKFKIESKNNKDLKLHGCGLLWN